MEGVAGRDDVPGFGEGVLHSHLGRATRILGGAVEQDYFRSGNVVSAPAGWKGARVVLELKVIDVARGNIKTDIITEMN